MKSRFLIALVSGVAPLGIASAAISNRSASPAEGAPVQLSPLHIVAKPITCFGLSLRIFARQGTRQIERILIEDVAPDSEADLRGLRPGDEILQADGRRVRAMVACFDPRSDLGRLFVHRRRGDRIVLEVQAAGAAKPRVVVLTHGASRADPWQPSEWP